MSTRSPRELALDTTPTLVVASEEHRELEARANRLRQRLADVDAARTYVADSEAAKRRMREYCDPHGTLPAIPRETRTPALDALKHELQQRLASMLRCLGVAVH